MEALLQNLQDQHLCVNDLKSMENLNVEEPPLPPPRKYVSVFRINGEPILPPLMTTEKRNQMQIFKEKAISIEQRLRASKHRAHSENGQNNEDTLLRCTDDNISQRSEDYYESKLKETEESIASLKTLIQRQQGGVDKNPVDTAYIGCNTLPHSYSDKNKEKLQKLQKSEILIYDNSANEVIQVPAGKQKKNVDDQRTQLRDIECQANFDNSRSKTHSQLLLAGINSKGMTAIPSICLNPPTPLAANKNLCEIFSDAESSESLITDTLSKSIDYGKDLSSDESFNSMTTQSTNKQNKKIRQNIAKPATKVENYTNAERNPLSPIKNMLPKIQHSEAMSSDTNTAQNTPERIYMSRKPCLEAATGTMSRSATSPSIKLTTSSRSSSCRSQILDQNKSPENTLVRSSSFTLEVPSKALIEHMQQQKSISDSNAASKSPLNVSGKLSKKSLSSPLRAHRDTVESKAKKVQKAEIKSSRQKIQQKASQSKLAQATAATNSPYYSRASAHNQSNLCKTKRSSYDISKTSQTSLQTLHKISSTQMRKSNSLSTNLAQSKTSKSRLASSTSTSCSSARTSHSDKESFKQMDKAQKNKFLQLLVQQEEEHRRLQESFEMQQKLLIDQLNRDMAATPLKSNKSYNSLQLSPESLHTRYDQNQISPRQQSQLNSKSFSQKPTTTTFILAQPIQYQLSHSAISNNSLHNSVDKSQSEAFNSQYLLNASNCTQSTPPHPLNNSYLSLVSHSNANTPVDTSMIHTKNVCATPTMQNDATQNMDYNRTASSRRRLFSAEIKDVGGGGNDLSSLSIARSPYTTRQPSVEQGQQPQHLNHADMNSIPLVNDSNRCPAVDDSLFLHAAATKINAYARGFLVRRLFQTEQIQRIVQTIRDTLIFVLSLHIETIENPEESQTPANIKLKARLLQQLSAACRTLHLVFFQTSIKERMEVIARDRKRIKTKLISRSRKRSPRIAG